MMFKLLRSDGSACNGGVGRWPLPSSDGPGEWTEPVEAPRSGVVGYHMTPFRHVLRQHGEALFIAEGRGKFDDGPFGRSYACARLLRRITGWGPATLRTFAVELAERSTMELAARNTCVAAMVDTATVAMGAGPEAHDNKLLLLRTLRDMGFYAAAEAWEFCHSAARLASIWAGTATSVMAIDWTESEAAQAMVSNVEAVASWAMFAVAGTDSVARVAERARQLARLAELIGLNPEAGVLGLH